MKKIISRRKLQLRSETLNVLRVLSANDLRDTQVNGASEPNCGPTGCPATNSGSQTK
jgi:hypothetical protein